MLGILFLLIIILIIIILCYSSGSSEKYRDVDWKLLRDKKYDEEDIEDDEDYDEILLRLYSQRGSYKRSHAQQDE